MTDIKKEIEKPSKLDMAIMEVMEGRPNEKQIKIFISQVRNE